MLVVEYLSGDLQNCVLIRLLLRTAYRANICVFRRITPVIQIWLFYMKNGRVIPCGARFGGKV